MTFFVVTSWNCCWTWLEAHLTLIAMFLDYYHNLAKGDRLENSTLPLFNASRWNCGGSGGTEATFDLNKINQSSSRTPHPQL